MSFHIHALNPGLFSNLHDLADNQLKPFRAKWVEAESNPGYPCRISLEDAAVGTKLLLVNFSHHSIDSPFQSSHAIYIDPTSRQAHPKIGTVPDSISSRLISWRAYDQAGLMVNADVTGGHNLAKELPVILGHENVDYVHLHNAKPGCYAARVTRA